MGTNILSTRFAIEHVGVYVHEAEYHHCPLVIPFPELRMPSPLLDNPVPSSQQVTITLPPKLPALRSLKYLPFCGENTPSGLLSGICRTWPCSLNARVSPFCEAGELLPNLVLPCRSHRYCRFLDGSATPHTNNSMR